MATSGNYINIAVKAWLAYSERHGFVYHSWPGWYGRAWLARAPGQFDRA